jgi:hypothetical protein
MNMRPAIPELLLSDRNYDIKGDIFANEPQIMGRTGIMHGLKLHTYCWLYNLWQRNKHIPEL